MDPIRKGFTSASSAMADSLCPGRHLAQRDIPEPPASDEANSGRKIHTALKNSSDTAALNALNATERTIFNDCRAIEKKIVLQWFGPECPPMRVYREERLWVKFYGPDKTIYEHSGEPDVIYHSGAKGLIIDYKTGVGSVEDASNNLQLRDLVCLFRGDQIRQKQILVECATAIIQPLVGGYDPILCSYNEPAMDRSAQEMMERIVASNDPKSPRVPGEVQCKWCRARAKCKEYQTWASATLPTFKGILELHVEEWHPEQRAIFMDRLPIAQQWLTDTKAAMEAGAIADPDFVPGYAMLNGQVKSPITDLKTLLERIVAHGGTAAELLQEASSITKKDLEAYFKKLVKGKIKGTLAQNKAFEELLEGVCTDKPNKPSLKPNKT